MASHGCPAPTIDLRVPDHLCKTNDASIAAGNAGVSEVHGVPVETTSINSTERQCSDEKFAMTKQNIGILAAEPGGTSSSPASSHEHNTSSTKDPAWRMLFFRLGPLSGIASLLLAILTVLVSLGVLLGSNGVPVEEWTVEPSAILAICTAVANQAMRYAAFQGLMIAWWYGALRGSTIEKLHNDWRAGMTIVGAILAGRRMGMLGLACIFSRLVAVDGPLLQKATRVVNAPVEREPVPLNVSILPEIPAYMWSGWVPTNQTTFNLIFNHTIPTVDNGSVSNDIEIQYSNPMYRIQGPWLRNEVISSAIRGCPSDSQCRLKVRAPALATTACTSYQLPVDYAQSASYIHPKPGPGIAPPLDREGFLIDIQLIVSGPKEKINLVTGYSRTAGCVGVLNYTACTFEAAIADYEVMVQGDAVTSLNAKTPTIVSLSNNTRTSTNWNSQMAWHDSALAGIALLLWQKWSGSVAWRGVDPSLGRDHISWGCQNERYMNYEHVNSGNRTFGCVDYLDPRDDIIEDMNRLMFYAGYFTGTRTTDETRAWFISSLDPGLDIDPTVTGHMYGYRNVYQTNFRWFGAAAGVEILCIALILPTFIGWWRLGRRVSFSPIEIAKAFEAPLLSDCNSNSSGPDIAKSIGGVRIQYGSTVDNSTQRRKLAFADDLDVQRPEQGSHFEI